ncbi:hypothetical protein LDO32_05125 [Luteimonas sp. Y-2-2-4F]|nr:DUF6116 family protein [Luteimonas sp. Y-2-2-4F]MCD9031112.1 hypothetical protein [Luteimonas sp. Y-2-2-4F]
MRYLFLAPALRWLGRLSYPRLFAVSAALFALTVVVPDPIPLVDELLLGLGTLLLARLKRPKDDAAAPPIDGRAERRR